jgi:stringent starvation protein B
MRLEIHRAARKHGISDKDIEHAVSHAMSVYDREDGTRLYLGSARNADLLEVSTIARPGTAEIAIHAMRMRPKYRRILPRD